MYIHITCSLCILEVHCICQLPFLSHYSLHEELTWLPTSVPLGFTIWLDGMVTVKINYTVLLSVLSLYVLPLRCCGVNHLMWLHGITCITHHLHYVLCYYDLMVSSLMVVCNSCHDPDIPCTIPFFRMKMARVLSLHCPMCCCCLAVWR